MDAAIERYILCALEGTIGSFAYGSVGRCARHAVRTSALSPPDPVTVPTAPNAGCRSAASASGARIVRSIGNTAAPPASATREDVGCRLALVCPLPGQGFLPYSGHGGAVPEGTTGGHAAVRHAPGLFGIYGSVPPPRRTPEKEKATMGGKGPTAVDSIRERRT